MKRVYECVSVECPTRMFTVGKKYESVPLYTRSLDQIVDDLGHLRCLAREERPRFIVGYDYPEGKAWPWPEIPQYAHFRLA